jgi:NAD(P)-dependent dehydrogenase (short-subunit alcohol dehydrogenase family)
MTHEVPQPVPGRLAGKTALVSGAAGGIGRAVCQRFAAEGAHVIVADVDGTGAAEVAASLSVPGQVEVFDHADESAVAEVFRRHARLDILVSNAGRAIPNQSVLDSDVSAFRMLLDANLIGHFVIAKHGAPRLQQSRGVVVFTASVTGRKAQPGAGLYGASKAGFCCTWPECLPWSSLLTSAF